VREDDGPCWSLPLVDDGFLAAGVTECRRRGIRAAAKRRSTWRPTDADRALIDGQGLLLALLRGRGEAIQDCPAQILVPDILWRLTPTHWWAASRHCDGGA